MNYHFKIHNDPDGLWAEGIELKNCHTQGENMKELLENLKEVLNLYLDEPAGSNMMFPLPDDQIKAQKGTVSVPVEPQIAFALLVRQARIDRRMSQSEAQKAMGFRSRNSYVRLESRANPSLEIIAKVKKVFPDLPIEKCFV